MNYLKLNQIIFIIIITLVTTLSRDISKEKNFRNYKGKGVKIAVLDSGIFNHKDFRDKKIIKYNIMNNSEVGDKLGHGTEVSGIITSIAPDVELYNVCILDESGEGNIETLMKALNWCIEMDIDIINLSFSTKIDNKKLRNYISRMWEKGIIMVSSYNNNRNIESFPAQYKHVIGVKSHVYKSFLVNDETVYALGHELKTTSNKGSYKYVTGNSYATAYTTGVICKIISELKEKKININHDEIVKRLKYK